MSQFNDFFISYQWDNKNHVKKLYQFLKSLNYTVLLDINRLVASKEEGLSDEQANVMKNSRVVICCITKAYDRDEHCKLEINWARRIKKPMIILMYENLKIEELNSVGLIISPLIRINLHNNLKGTWRGPKRDELIKAISSTLNQQVLPLSSGFIWTDQILLSGYNEDSIKLWSLNNCKCEKELEGHSDYILCMQVINDELFASGGEDCTVKIWDLKSYKCIATLKGHDNTIHSLALINSKSIASGSSDETIKVWSLEDFCCVKTLVPANERNSSILCLQFIEPNLLASGCTNKIIKLWNLKEFSEIRNLEGHIDYVTCLQALDSNLLASGSFDKIIKIWDLVNFNCIFNFKGHGSFVRCLKLIDNYTLVSGGDDKTIKIWNLRENICSKTIQVESTVSCLEVINPYTIAAGTEFDDIKLININEQSFKTLKGPIESINVHCLAIIYKN